MEKDSLAGKMEGSLLELGKRDCRMVLVSLRMIEVSGEEVFGKKAGEFNGLLKTTN